MSQRPIPTEAATAGQPPGNPPAVRPGTVLAIGCIAIVLANLDLFIVNVALPDIGRDFRGAGLDGLSWILNGYAITYAALLVFWGRLAERHRRDLSFLLGVALFTAASAACAAAVSVETLVGFRVVQAAGAALMTPTSLGLLLASYPADRRGAAVRTWTAIGGLAAALGPLVGGLLVTVDWRWIFLVNVPIGLAALLIGKWKLPAVPGHDVPPPSLWAALLVTAGIAALTFGIVAGNDWGWRSPGILASFGFAAGSLALFVGHCVRAANPFVDPALFRIRPYAGAALVMAPYSAAFGAMLLSITVWEQAAWGWSAMQAGLALALGPLMVPLTSLLLAGRLIARFGAATVITAGIALFAGGLAWWALRTRLEPDAVAAVLTMIPLGMGVGLVFPTLMGLGVSALPASSFATGSGVINMIRQACLAIGVAVFVAIVGSLDSAPARLESFRLAWWMMVGLTGVGLVPTFLFIRVRRNPPAEARPTGSRPQPSRSGG